LRFLQLHGSAGASPSPVWSFKNLIIICARFRSTIIQVAYRPTAIAFACRCENHPSFADAATGTVAGRPSRFVRHFLPDPSPG
jgi:hypothetical protein